MSLSSELISEFAKLTKEDNKQETETTLYGTTVEYNGTIYVKLDGSDRLTPVSKTADYKPNERVTVMIKNHNAVVTGNVSSPAARTDDVKDVANQVSEFEIVMAHKVTTNELDAFNAVITNLYAITSKYENMEAVIANIESLEAEIANLKYVSAEEIEAFSAKIESVQTTFLESENITAEDLEAANADIDKLKAYTAEFTYVSAEVLESVKAEIKSLDTVYANIDFSNIGKAAMEYFYAESGLIHDIAIGDATISGTLAGVTIIGDTIQGGTIKADKLVVKGSDGIYYKLNIEAGVTSSEEVSEDELQNGLHGDAIIAKSITAEKVDVKDLIAFGATIGGFTITENSIYSDVKDSSGNYTRGVYFDTDGQVNFGDANNYIKYVKDEDGNYKLAISAENIMYALNGTQHSLADIGTLGEYVTIGVYEGEPCIELGEKDSDFKLIITNTRILFNEGTITPAYINNESLNITKAVVKEELHMGNTNTQLGEYVWKVRSNGNMGLQWKGAVE